MSGIEEETVRNGQTEKELLGTGSAGREEMPDGPAGIHAEAVFTSYENVRDRRNAGLRKKTYSVKCPKRFVFGDPFYFDEFEGEKLEGLVADYQPPRGFDARVVLEEKAMEEYPDFIERTMTLYMAPEKTIQTYVDGLMYEGQDISVKEIGVDTASYLIDVDGRSDEIKTDGDGYWGECQEFWHKQNGRQFLDAVTVTVVVPEFEDWSGMERLAGYFFEEMKLLSSQEAAEPQMKLE